MARACRNNTVIAETETFETVEGNIYFPKSTIIKKHFKTSEHTSFCPWKGTANYFHIIVDDAENSNAAWYYSSPKKAAANIKDHVAFWNGVAVEV